MQRSGVDHVGVGSCGICSLCVYTKRHWILCSRTLVITVVRCVCQGSGRNLRMKSTAGLFQEASGGSFSGVRRGSYEPVTPFGAQRAAKGFQGMYTCTPNDYPQLSSSYPMLQRYNPHGCR